MAVLSTVGKVATGAVLGATLMVTWNGQPTLEEIQQKTENFVGNVIEMKAEYEAVISDKQIEINDIKSMYYAKEEEVEELKKQLEEVKSEGNKTGLYKKELEKANADVEAHKKAMDEILDESIFE